MPKELEDQFEIAKTSAMPLVSALLIPGNSLVDAMKGALIDYWATERDAIVFIKAQAPKTADILLEAMLAAQEALKNAPKKSSPAPRGSRWDI